MNTTSLAEVKVYRILPRTLIGRLFFAVVLMLIVPVIMYFSDAEYDSVVWIVYFAVVVLVVAVVSVIAWRGGALEVSSQGIAFVSVGMRISSAWKDVIAIEKRLILNEGDVEGLVLSQPVVEKTSFIRWGKYTSPMAYLSSKQFDSFIPISNLRGDDWRDQEIGQDILRYAPHLFNL